MLTFDLWAVEARSGIADAFDEELDDEEDDDDDLEDWKKNCRTLSSSSLHTSPSLSFGLGPMRGPLPTDVTNGFLENAYVVVCQGLLLLLHGRPTSRW